MLKTRNGLHELKESHLTNLNKLENLGTMVHFSKQQRLKMSLVDSLNLTDHLKNLINCVPIKDFLFSQVAKKNR